MSKKSVILLTSVALLALVFLGRNSTPAKVSAAAEVQSAPSAASSSKPAPSPNANASKDKTEYEEKLSLILEGMPTLTQQKLKLDKAKEIHGFTAEEFAEGHKLAEIRKLSLQNEEFLPSTQNTYASCAERHDLANSVRAICFTRALEISIKLKNPQHIVGLNVPANIRELALKLHN